MRRGFWKMLDLFYTTAYSRMLMIADDSRVHLRCAILQGNFIPVILACLLLLPSTSHAQLTMPGSAVPETPPLVTEPPSQGTFYLHLGPAGGRPCPLLPCPSGDMPGTSIYALPQAHRFIVDDRSIDDAAKRKADAPHKALEELEAERSSSSGHTSADLWLEMRSFSNDICTLVIHPPENERSRGVYDLFGAGGSWTDLPQSGGADWVWLARTEPGQTNITAVGITGRQGFYRLARTNDSNADGITDACEELWGGGTSVPALRSLKKNDWKRHVQGRNLRVPGERKGADIVGLTVYCVQ